MSGSNLLIVALTVLNTLSFLCGYFFPELRDSMQMKYPVAQGGTLFLSGEWMRIIGYTFVHSGVLHLMFNMLVLWMAGNRLATLQGLPRTLAAYICGAIGGGVGFSIMASALDSFSLTLCGASAAVLGICGALFTVVKGRTALRSRMTAVLPAGIARLLPEYISRRSVIAGVVLMTVVCNPSPVAIATHLTGFLAGIAAGISQKVLGGWSAPARCHANGTDTGATPAETGADTIIEKVRRSGYSSLTESERRRLRRNN